LTPQASTRRSGGGEGERRLRAPGRDVGGLEIFFLFHLSRGVLMTDDRLGLDPSGVAPAKALKSCVGVAHVEVDVENTPEHPTLHANCREISFRKNTGTTRRTQRYRMQGAVRVRSRERRRSTATEDSTRQIAHRTTENDTDLTQVEGPRGEVKPLRPAFLYCTTRPREAYKVLVTKL
jgi:hypothetical protein